MAVAAASFLLLSLTWPFSVRSYVSRGVIDVDVIRTPVATKWFKQQLGQIVQHHTSDGMVSRLAQQTHDAIPGPALAELSASSDFASRFGVHLAKGNDDGDFRLTTNIARDFLASPHAKMGTGKLLSPTESGPSSEALKTDLLAQSEQLNQRAGEIFSRLESASSQTSESKFGRTNASPFLNVAHSSGPVVDTQSEIAELKQTVGKLSGLVEESVSNGSEIAFSVRKVSAQLPTPVNGSPKLPHIILLSAISGFLATVVTIAFRPLESRGFENIASVVQKLGVPVVATLGDASEDVSNYGSSSGQAPWANRIVSFAELILFALTIVAISFCVLNPEIRAAFADNLFHGFARIAWMFQN